MRYEISYEAGKGLGQLVAVPWARGRVVPWVLKSLGSSVEADRNGAGSAGSSS